VADDHIWQPKPMAEADFYGDDGMARINRAPLDVVSGVVYKRAAATKSVTQAFCDPDTSQPWQGRGSAVVRWLFSEQPGTAEGLLTGRTFAFLQALVLAPGTSTAERALSGVDVLLVVVAGDGRLYHRPAAGSAIVTRPLREGDAVLVRAGELYSVSNEGEEGEMRSMVLGLRDVGNPDGGM